MFAPKLLSSCPQQTERIYSRAIYPVISRVLGAASSIFPFSVAEVLIISVGTLLAVTLVVRLFKLVFSKLLKRKHNRMRFYSCLISLGMFAGAMLNLFYALWGINHYRMPAASLLGLSDELERVNSAKSEFIAAAETGDNWASSDIYAEMLASTCEKLRLRLRRTEAAFVRTKTVCLSQRTKTQRIRLYPQYSKAFKRHMPRSAAKTNCSAIPSFPQNRCIFQTCSRALIFPESIFRTPPKRM